MCIGSNSIEWALSWMDRWWRLNTAVRTNVMIINASSSVSAEHKRRDERKTIKVAIIMYLFVLF